MIRWVSRRGGGILCKYLILEGEEVERLRTMMHEQGRDIDQLKQASIINEKLSQKIKLYLKENKDQKKTIEQLESLLEEEITLRKEDLETFTVTIETEVQERIFHDRKLTTVVNEDRDVNMAQLTSLRDDMIRENEMLR